MIAPRWISMLIGITALLIILPTQAQPPQPITPGAIIEDQIASTGATRAWTFFAFKDDVLSFQVEPLDTTLDPLITLSIGETPLISNDDYHYPDSRAALLEAITIPRTGEYRLTVSGYNDSTGRFRLSMHSGYSDLIFDETPTAPRGTWQTEGDLSAQITENGIELTLDGIAQRSIYLETGLDPLLNYYIQTTVQITSAVNGWLVGLALRYQPDGRYYLLQIRSQGGWRMLRVEGETEEIIRNWTPHPAIVAGETTFMLNALVKDSGIDIFYNGQLIGKTRDATLADAGRFGLVIETADALSSQVAATFDTLRITQALRIDGQTVFPQHILYGDINQTVHELERRNIIPTGGQLSWEIPESFVELNGAGVNRLILQRGLTFREYALSATFRLRQLTDGITGCGLVLNNRSDTDYLLAYFDQTGGYGLSQRSGAAFEPGIFGQLPTVNTDNHLVIIARSDQLIYFINGVYVGTLPVTLTEGEVGNALVNFDPLNATCQFRSTWLWRWD